jgi:hypothetical protein
MFLVEVIVPFMAIGMFFTKVILPIQSYGRDLIIYAVAKTIYAVA